MEKGDILYCQKEIKQPMMQWNLVLKLTQDIADQASLSGVKAQNLVFLGGIAIYLHSRKALGDKVVNRWRGTHDIDLVVTEKGGAGKILSGIQKSHNYEYIEPLRSHFPDKQTWEIKSQGKGYLNDKERTIDIDVYLTNSATGYTNLNGRQIGAYPDKFISQPVETITTGAKYKTAEVAVPSLLDCLIMKLDVAATDGKLRNKDRSDILCLLMINEKQGGDGQQFINQAIDKISGSKKIKPVLAEMESLFTNILNCYRKRKIDPEMTGFIPSEKCLKRCKETTQNIQEILIGTIDRTTN